MLVLALLTLGLAAPFFPFAGLLAMGLLVVYLAAAALVAASATLASGAVALVLVMFSFAIMHFAYGLGLLHGFVDFFLLRRAASFRMSGLTR